MNPAPAFSARGQHGGWTHRRKLYCEAFDSLTLLGKQKFAIGGRFGLASKLPPAVALGRHRTPLILQRAQTAAQGAAGQASTPAQPAQPDTPSSSSSTTTVSTEKAGTGPTDQAEAPVAPPRASSGSQPRRPSSRAGGGTKLWGDLHQEGDHQRQGINLPP